MKKPQFIEEEEVGMMSLRYCKSCERKTNHAKVTEHGNQIYYLVCDECGKMQKKQSPPQKKIITSDQYPDGVLSIEKENRAYIKTPQCGVRFPPSPHCKVHGAMLRYEHNIWRCVECGFAVKWKKGYQ